MRERPDDPAGIERARAGLRGRLAAEGGTDLRVPPWLPAAPAFWTGPDGAGLAETSPDAPFRAAGIDAAAAEAVGASGLPGATPGGSSPP